MNFCPVVIATGLSSCAGEGVESAWKYLISKECLLKKQNLFQSPKNNFRLCGEANLTKGKNKNFTNCEKLLAAAIDEALKQIDLKKFDPKKIGVFIGTSIGNVFECENELQKKFDLGEDKSNWSVLAKYECSAISDFVAKRAKAKGVRFAVSTACSSSGLALEAAANAISAAELDAAIVCGVDALSRITVNGFASLQLLSENLCKPFDKNRDGINLGEAAALVVLTSKHHAEKFGMEIAAEIPACASTADAYHATSPHPEAEGIERAMRETLSRAKLSAEQIDFYNAHGTATIANDKSESCALNKVFWKNIPPFSSIKGKFGHTLGASGLLNLVLSIKAISTQTIPANFGFSQIDENINLSPVQENLHTEIKNIMSSSIGFGGNNSCVLISKNFDQSVKQTQSKKLYLNGYGAVFNNATSEDEIFDERKSDILCSIDSLLKNIAPLKKRRWAKLQQMILNASIAATQNSIEEIDKLHTCVCIGTGLGMTEQTQKFLENTILKKESEPLPTAFTNSVHNATSSAISVYFGLKGLNSAVSAKELSFEAALWHASKQINSDAADCAIIGACDEFNPYAKLFLHLRKSTGRFDFPLSEVAAAYLLSAKKTSNTFAEILSLNICDCEKDFGKEAAIAIAEFNRLKIIPEKLNALIAPVSLNKFGKNFIEQFALQMGIKKTLFLDEQFGLNYSLSSFAPLAAKRMGKGIYASFTKASTGQKSFLIFEIL